MQRWLRVGSVGFVVLAVGAAACGSESSEPFGTAHSGPHPRAQPASGPICPGQSPVRECPPGAVDAYDFCAMPCRLDSECGPGPEWRCDAWYAWTEAGAPDGLCRCESVGEPWSAGREACDGRDNDCNGAIDDGATCPNGAVCVAGDCECPPDRQCNAGCADTQADPEHCGGCNNACVPPENARALCGLGACTFMCLPGFADCDDVGGCETNGSCALEVLAQSGESYVASLALDHARVYWLEQPLSDGWAIRAVEKSGGPPETVANGAGDVRSIRSDGTRLHWAIDGLDRRVVALAYGSAATTTYQETETSPVHVSPSPGALIWTTYVDLPVSCWGPWSLEALAILDDGAAQPIRMKPPGWLGFGPAEMIGQHVFVANSFGLSRAVRGCDHWAFVQGAPGASYYSSAQTKLATDSRSIFWTRPFHDDDPVHGIERADVGGTAVERLYEGDRPWSLAPDAATVYFGTEHGLFRVAKSGGDPVLVASEARAVSLALDDTHVYWFDRGDPEGLDDSSVRRIRK